MKFKVISVSIIIILCITLIFFVTTEKKLDQKDKQIDEIKKDNIIKRIESYEDEIKQIDTVIPIISDVVIISKSDSIVRANGF